MYLHAFFIQHPLSLATEPGALGSLSTVTMSVFAVFMIFLLWVTTHWYQRRGMVEKKKKRGRKVKGPARVDDSIMRLEFMSRSELRDMILREREQRGAVEGSGADLGVAGESAEKDIVAVNEKGQGRDGRSDDADKISAAAKIMGLSRPPQSIVADLI